MTERRGRHPFAVAAWILAGAVVVATTVGIVGGILSPSLVVDLVALWPLFAVILVWGAIGWVRARRKRARAGAIMPLTLFTAVVLAVAVHLGAWDELPTSEARLSGPPAARLSEHSTFTAQIVGDLRIDRLDGGSAYRVKPILRGGEVGVPSAMETSVDGDLSIVVSADADAPGWYRFSGWEVALTPDTAWRLVLNGKIDADLARLMVASGAMAGSGRIRLGPAAEGGSGLVVAGAFTIVVPPDSPVTVTGDAEVPDTWLAVDGTARSPVAGEGWSLNVQGGNRIVVVEG